MDNYRKCTITIQPDNEKINCYPGDNLLQVLNESEVGIRSLCGGEGTCNKCLVIVKNGQYRELRKPQLPEEKKDKNYVLSCQVEIEGDMEIKVPEKSRLRKQQILTKDEDDFQKNFEQKIAKDPVYRQQIVKLPPPSLVDNSADLERFKRILKKEANIEELSFPYSLIKDLSSKLRKNDWQLSVSWIKYGTSGQIVDLDSAPKKDYYGLALDIGTTTVAGKLINLSNNVEIASAGKYNKQIKFGEDVISRINYSKNHDQGLKTLQRTLIKTINEIISELIEEEGIKNDEIRMIVAAGNTTMAHTLYELDPNNIRKSPYIPVAANLPPLTAEDLDIDIHPQGLIQIFPAVGSFVGGDITAGVLATDLHKKEELTLFIDIGTNGEIVLGNKEFLMCCSASAGPAFEGGGITHGIRAMEGAIEKVEIQSWNQEVKYKTINNKAAVGICGSGLIELLAVLEEANIINRSGQFNRQYSGSRLRTSSEKGKEFVIARTEESGIDEDIVITEDDIKNLMRSKAAVYAGIRMILKNLAMEENMIDKVLIAGGFGNYLNLEAAIRIGLFPDLPRQRFQFIGNSSLKGAKQAMLSHKLLEEGLDLGKQMTYLELSAESQATDFMDEFIAAQFIPHTELKLFPSLHSKKEDQVSIV